MASHRSTSILKLAGQKPPGTVVEPRSHPSNPSNPSSAFVPRKREFAQSPSVTVDEDPQYALDAKLARHELSFEQAVEEGRRDLGPSISKLGKAFLDKTARELEDIAGQAKRAPPNANAKYTKLGSA
ncbi:uncharacterized protein JCM15063_005323 [Sporobolomyces koalae]|uniref:uncharacterized protein n=1 Tax=Sporobolomyces koalae TaxID=500713 RepID=UPI00316DE51B